MWYNLHYKLLAKTTYAMHKEDFSMKRVIENLKKKREAQKMELPKVMRLIGLPTAKDTTVKFEMLEGYELKWFKKRIFQLAKSLSVGVALCYEEQEVIFLCQSFEQAIFFASCIDKDTRERTFSQFFEGSIKK